MQAGNRNAVTFLSLAAAAAIFFLAAGETRAQQQPLPEGYVRPAPVQPGHAPKMKVESAANTGSHVYQVHFGSGDEILSGLTELAEREHITAGYIMGLGGLSTGLLGWGDPSNGAFRKIPIDKKCELVSLVGNISMRNGMPYVHLHGVVAFSDGSTKGGHVIEAHVAPIAEITVVATAESD